MRKYICLILALPVIYCHALELELQPCNSINAQITDIEFTADRNAFITAKNGGLYYFRGCDVPTKKIASFAVETASELGLLGVAVAPNNAMYLYYSPISSPVITRLSVFDLVVKNDKPVIRDEKILLEINQPFNNHDGGALKIGDDGNVYLGVGDGGAANDPHDNGQNLKTLLGSIVRITPDKKAEKGYRIPKGNLVDFEPSAAPEILAAGLRNPWKFNFDSKGNLIVADVGQNKFEEVTLIPHQAIAKQALNLGWRYREAAHCFNPKTQCESEAFLEPLFEYGRDVGASITGGETLQFENNEYYLFADFVSGFVGAITLDEPSTLVAEKRLADKRWTTFGKSPSGEVYIANMSGDIYRVLLK